MISCFSSYLGIAANSENVKYNKIAYKLYPYNTDAMAQQLYLVTGDEQYSLAKRIYALNKNSSQVYKVFSLKEQEKRNYDKALEYEKTCLLLNKYRIEYYINYSSFLGNAVKYYYESGDIDKAKVYMKEIIMINSIIDNVLKDTNVLCYKTIHPPELNLPDNVKIFIEQITELYESI